MLFEASSDRTMTQALPQSTCWTLLGCTTVPSATRIPGCAQDSYEWHLHGPPNGSLHKAADRANLMSSMRQPLRLYECRATAELEFRQLIYIFVVHIGHSWGPDCFTNSPLDAQ